MQVQHKNISKRDYLLVIVLIFLSGSPVLLLTNPMVYGVLGSLFFLYSLLRKDVAIRKNLWIYLLFLILIFISQYFTLGVISVLGSMNILAKVVLGATILWIVKERFRLVYLNIMFYISLISLILSIPGVRDFIVPGWFETEGVQHSILIYTVGTTLRNSGPFWEPGAFACYLVLVPLLFLENLKESVLANKFKFFILLLALITTLSTTGYICLTTIILYSIIRYTKNKLLLLFFIMPIVLYFLSLFMNSLDFLNEKIVSQYENIKNLSGEYSNQRFGAFIFDLHYINKHPLCGNGLIDITRFADHRELWDVKLGHGNGFSDYIVRMGVLSFIVYIGILFRNISNSYSTSFFVVLIIIMLLQGEALLNYPLFLGLPFIINSTKNNRKDRKEKVDFQTVLNKENIQVNFR